MAKLGYGYEKLSKRFPNLIYASCSGFGQTGPWASKPAYDMIVQGMGGLMSVTGHEGLEPVRVGTSIARYYSRFIYDNWNTCRFDR